MAGPDNARKQYSEKPADDAKFSSTAAEDGLHSEVAALMDRAEATMTLAAAWTENLSRLVHLEFQRTLAAGKRIVALLLLVFFLAIALVVSLCAGLGLLGYYFFQSVYIGFGIFLLAQLLIVAAMLLSAHRLRRLLGFEETRKQAKEAIDDVTALFKQTD
ncbi:hypothetical protein [Microbulbifer pacificus]|uniref:Phage holin family protein n=1 Tax=Microbulbifer pacificus TaxID=407164 RepID=A0AAU0N1B4_9GAMM|nr:hypothetical protein [Microbulbifer pacificus]WOX06596.1 hypothetical protein R5R33_05540 [Microbulbifer pacificus]